MTLAEVMVVGGLLLLLLGIVARTLAPGLRAWRRGNVRADLQGNALLVVHALQHEVDASSADQVAVWKRTYDAAGDRDDALAVGSPYAPGAGLTFDSGGAPAWRSLAVYYVLPTRREVWRLEIPVNGPPVAAMPAAVHTALDAGGVPAVDGIEPVRVGRFLTSLAVDGDGPPWRLTVGTGAQNESCRMETALVPALTALSTP